MTAVDLANAVAVNGPNADVLAAISKWQDLRQDLVKQGRYAAEGLCDRAILQLLQILRERSALSVARDPVREPGAPTVRGRFARPWIGAEPWARWPGNGGAA